MTSNLMVQSCRGCGARWQVRAAPMQWCPRCRAALQAPAPYQGAAPARAISSGDPRQRPYRWIARSPVGSGQRGRSVPTAPGATPGYRVMPRWGLVDLPPVPARPEAEDEPAARAAQLLMCATAVFVLAAVAELCRYVILLRNRTQLIDSVVLRLSDTAVVTFAGLALVLALLAGLLSVSWLVHARSTTFEREGRSDPRPRWVLVAGCLIPIVNLVMTGVFLTELAAPLSPRVRWVVRVWWGAWIVGAAMSVAALCLHFAQSLEVRANGVLFYAITDLVAAGVALVTLWLIRETEGRDLMGRTHVPRRLLAAVGPAESVIAEVTPPSTREPEEVTAS